MNPEGGFTMPQPDHEGDAFFDRSLYEVPKKKKEKDSTEDRVADAQTPEERKALFRKVFEETLGEEQAAKLLEGERTPPREGFPFHRAAHVKKKKFR